MSRSLPFLCLALLFPAASIRADDAFRQQVELLREFCFRCHGEQKQEASLRLDRLDPDMVEGVDGETWHDVLNKLNVGEMPPAKSKQPTPAQRKKLTRWIGGELERAAAAQRSTGGRVVLRRLTRYEYNNTMRDLLGVDLDFAKDLPPDPPSADGFQNTGASLGISPLQIEYYLKAARAGLRRAVVTGPAPPVFTHHAEQSEKTRRKKEQVSNQLGPANRFLARMEKFPREGEFSVKIRASAIVPEGAGYPRMRVALGVRADVRAPEATLAEVDVSSSEPTTFDFRGRIEKFPLPGHNPKFPGLQVTIYNTYQDPDAKPQKKPKKKSKKNKQNKTDKQAPSEPTEPLIVIHSVDFEGPLYDSWPPASHRQIFFDSKRPADEQDETRYAREILQRFMRRAYRRPPAESDVEAMLKLLADVRPRHESFEEAMREVLAMVLVSPQFLYLFEPREEDGKERLSDHELAARLSYFLWSTMPDQRLLQLADEGQLRDGETLEAEVRRMIQSPRSWQFVTHFAGQWLDLSGVNRVAVNPEFYPNFDERLKADMRDETLHFFAEILRSDLSCRQLLDSDFTMLNRRLARNYGIAPLPMGSEFQRVALTDKRRGGLLTQGSFLLSNSNGGDSHPIKRAVWLLDRLLDDPPAPPPPDVPDLDPAQADLQGKSLKQQLEIHRTKQACNNCHREIDPWGVTLENFDAIGRWRTEVAAVGKRKATPVDPQVTLPDGAEIDGVVQLKQHLLEHRQQQFARALVQRLLTYGLGRSLELGDRQQVDELTRQFVAADLRLSPLLVAIVRSEPFQTK